MDIHDRDFLDEQDLEAYQFLFNLPKSDKQILADFANLSNITDWEKMVEDELKGDLPAFDLLDKIHLQFVCDAYDYQEPFEKIGYDRLQQIADDNEKRHNGILNHLEVNVIALIESLKQSKVA